MVRKQGPGLDGEKIFDVDPISSVRPFPSRKEIAKIRRAAGRGSRMKENENEKLVAKQRAEIDGHSIKQLASIDDMDEADDQEDQLLRIEDNEEISDFDLDDMIERSSDLSHDEDILNDMGSSAEEHTSSDPQMSED